MSGRVSVDKAALDALIEAAVQDCGSVIQEFCCSKAESDAAWAEHERLVAALDVQGMST